MPLTPAPEGFPRFVADELYQRQYASQSPAEAALDYLAIVLRDHTRSHGEQRFRAHAAVQGYFDWKARQPKNVDTPTSHLRNALQVSTLLAAELPKMIGNPGYQDDAAKSLASIAARICAALEQLEGKPL